MRHKEWKMIWLASKKNRFQFGEIFSCSSPPLKMLWHSKPSESLLCSEGYCELWAVLCVRRQCTVKRGTWWRVRIACPVAGICHPESLYAFLETKHFHSSVDWRVIIFWLEKWKILTDGKKNNFSCTHLETKGPQKVKKERELGGSKYLL